MDGTTDRHDEANNCFSQFYERAEHCTAELDEVGGGFRNFLSPSPHFFFLLLYQTGISVVAVRHLFFKLLFL